MCSVDAHHVKILNHWSRGRQQPQTLSIPEKRNKNLKEWDYTSQWVDMSKDFKENIQQYNITSFISQKP